MAVLSTERRNKLPRSAFGLPAQRKYPLVDKSHARNALARVSANGSPYEQAQVRKRVYRKFPELRRLQA